MVSLERISDGPEKQVQLPLKHAVADAPFGNAVRKALRYSPNVKITAQQDEALILIHTNGDPSRLIVEYCAVIYVALLPVLPLSTVLFT